MDQCFRCEMSTATVQCEDCASSEPEPVIYCDECSAITHIGKMAKHRFHSMLLKEQKEDTAERFAAYTRECKSLELRVYELEQLEKNIQEMLRVHERNIRRRVVEIQDRLKKQAGVLMVQLKDAAKVKVDKISLARDHLLGKIAEMEECGAKVQDVLNLDDFNFAQTAKEQTNIIHQTWTRPDISTLDLPSAWIDYKIDFTAIENVIETLKVQFHDGKPKELVLEKPEFESGEEVPVLLCSSLQKNGTFTVGPLHNSDAAVTLHALSLKIRAELLKEPDWMTYGCQERQPSINDLVFARHPCDKKWYRARVREKPKGPQNDVMVMFLDYGNLITIGTESLLPWRPVAPNCHFQAVVCSMFDTIDLQLPIDPVWLFHDLTHQHNCFCRAKQKIENANMWQVDLFVQKEREVTKTCVNEQIIANVESARQAKGAIMCRDIRYMDQKPNIEIVKTGSPQKPPPNTETEGVTTATGDLVTAKQDPKPDNVSGNTAKNTLKVEDGGPEKQEEQATTKDGSGSLPIEPVTHQSGTEAGVVTMTTLQVEGLPVGGAVTEEGLPEANGPKAEPQQLVDPQTDVPNHEDIEDTPKGCSEYKSTQEVELPDSQASESPEKQQPDPPGHESSPVCGETDHSQACPGSEVNGVNNCHGLDQESSELPTNEGERSAVTSQEGHEYEQYQRPPGADICENIQSPTDLTLTEQTQGKCLENMEQTPEHPEGDASDSSEPSRGGSDGMPSDIQAKGENEGIDSDYCPSHNTANTSGVSDSTRSASPSDGATSECSGVLLDSEASTVVYGSSDEDAERMTTTERATGLLDACGETAPATDITQPTGNGSQVTAGDSVAIKYDDQVKPTGNPLIGNSEEGRHGDEIRPLEEPISKGVCPASDSEVPSGSGVASDQADTNPTGIGSLGSEAVQTEGTDLSEALDPTLSESKNDHPEESIPDKEHSDLHISVTMAVCNSQRPNAEGSIDNYEEVKPANPPQNVKTCNQPPSTDIKAYIPPSPDRSDDIEDWTKATMYVPPPPVDAADDGDVDAAGPEMIVPEAAARDSCTESETAASSCTNRQPSRDVLEPSEAGRLKNSSDNTVCNQSQAVGAGTDQSRTQDGVPGPCKNARAITKSSAGNKMSTDCVPEIQTQPNVESQPNDQKKFDQKDPSWGQAQPKQASGKSGKSSSPQEETRTSQGAKPRSLGDCLPKLCLCENISFRGKVVSDIDTEGMFWMQLARETQEQENAFRIFEKQLQEYGKLSVAVSELRGSSMMLAEYKGMFHRAIYYQAKGASRGVVQLIDAGQRVTVPHSALREISQNLEKYPNQAVECCLKTAQYLTFNDMARKLFSKLVKDKTLDVFVERLGSHGLFAYVKVFDNSDNQSVNIYTRICQEGTVGLAPVADFSTPPPTLYSAGGRPGEMYPSAGAAAVPPQYYSPVPQMVCASDQDKVFMALYDEKVLDKNAMTYSMFKDHILSGILQNPQLQSQLIEGSFPVESYCNPVVPAAGPSLSRSTNGTGSPRQYGTEDWNTGQRGRLPDTQELPHSQQSQGTNQWNAGHRPGPHGNTSHRQSYHDNNSQHGTSHQDSRSHRQPRNLDNRSSDDPSSRQPQNYDRAPSHSATNQSENYGNRKPQPVPSYQNNQSSTSHVAREDTPPANSSPAPSDDQLSNFDEDAWVEGEGIPTSGGNTEDYQEQGYDASYHTKSYGKTPDGAGGNRYSSSPGSVSVLDSRRGSYMPPKSGSRGKARGRGGGVRK